VLLVALAGCSGSSRSNPDASGASADDSADDSSVAATMVTVAGPAESDAPTGLDDTSSPALAEQCSPAGTPALAAYELADGELRWLRCEAGDGRRSVVAAVDGVAYLAEQVADATGAPTAPRLVAIDVTNGTPLWTHDIAAVPPGPFVASGVAVVGIEDVEGRAVVALDPATGDVVWRQAITGAAPVAITDSTVVLRSSDPPPDWTPPVTDPGGSTFAFFRALDRATGTETWTAEIVTPVDADAAQFGATIDGDTVVLLPGPVALDATTGHELWRANADLGNAVPGPIEDGIVVWGGQDDPTQGLDETTGGLVWTMPGSPAYDDVWAVGDGAVYVVEPATAEMVAYELADGSERWRRPFDGIRNTWPYEVAGEIVFAMWSNLDALSTADGSVLWSTDYPPADFPRMTGIAADDTGVFVALSSAPSSAG
jgi:outer membrane protein assembly factor BamB